MLFETGATFKIYHELLSETEPIRIDESTEFKIRFTVYFIIIPQKPSQKKYWEIQYYVDRSKTGQA